MSEDAYEHVVIVRALAERGVVGEPHGGGGLMCEFCSIGDDRDVALSDDALDDPLKHRVDCLWRRAMALYPRVTA